ncbi:MAG: D-2-hydroxyacid dehydrogenase [bacterium]|nr:D-2-hydroxyacid dehydrogenase [bacterium]
MKVLVADPLDPGSIEELRKLRVDVEDLSGIPKEELPNRVGDFDVMVVRSATKVRKEMIDKMQQMKLIIRGGVGLDNIDADYAKSKGIKVVNTPGASSASVAELALAHMFAISRHIARGTQSIKEGQWEKKALTGIELSGKTLGIIGVGRVGKELAKRATALGMNVIGYDPYVKAVEGIKLVDLDTLIRTSDYISLHIPLTSETKHIIGKAGFEKMKPGVVIVNCARGGVIDESALLDALKSGKLAGAGLDVFETEPPAKSELMGLPNVTFTPHIGASTKEAQERIGKEVVNIIREFGK